MRIETRRHVWGLTAGLCLAAAPADGLDGAEIGKEVSVHRHLRDGEEFTIGLDQLIDHGRTLFSANWTVQEGAGRPLSTGTGAPVADPSRPLVFPRDRNRVSGPDANSCAGCHNTPATGGGGDLVANVFVQGQRFDFATFDGADMIPRSGAFDERGKAATLQSIANSRVTLAMHGSGYIEMLARQMTAELQAQRNRVPAGGSVALSAKGVDFGVLARRADGSWDTSRVEGLPAPSIASAGSFDPPSLIVRPFHQSGSVVSIRQFTVNAFNHHHGIQPTERFGFGTDPDGDGIADEMTVADVTAATIFQVTLPVPGRVIPNDPAVEKAIRLGERRFREIGCAQCHVPALPLDNHGWVYTEPNPLNPLGTLATGARLQIDLTHKHLPGPRLRVEKNGVVWVPAFTDLKLHDICDGPSDPNIEPLDMNEATGSGGFFSGNRRFITKKLWGAASLPAHFHHGQFTTLREAVEAHRGEALGSYNQWRALPEMERDSIIEFLKSLQILPAGVQHLVVDERGRPKEWPTKPRQNQGMKGDGGIKF